MEKSWRSSRSQQKCTRSIQSICSSQHSTKISRYTSSTPKTGSNSTSRMETRYGKLRTKMPVQLGSQPTSLQDTPLHRWIVHSLVRPLNRRSLLKEATRIETAPFPSRRRKVDEQFLASRNWLFRCPCLLISRSMASLPFSISLTLPLSLSFSSFRSHFQYTPLPFLGAESP